MADRSEYFRINTELVRVLNTFNISSVSDNNYLNFSVAYLSSSLIC